MRATGQFSLHAYLKLIMGPLNNLKENFAMRKLSYALKLLEVLKLFINNQLKPQSKRDNVTNAAIYQNQVGSYRMVELYHVQ